MGMGHSQEKHRGVPPGGLYSSRELDQPRSQGTMAGPRVLAWMVLWSRCSVPPRVHIMEAWLPVWQLRGSGLFKGWGLGLGCGSVVEFMLSTHSPEFNPQHRKKELEPHGDEVTRSISFGRD